MTNVITSAMFGGDVEQGRTEGSRNNSWLSPNAGATNESFFFSSPRRQRVPMEDSAQLVPTQTFGLHHIL